jgi:hypothetical protein
MLEQTCDIFFCTCWQDIPGCDKFKDKRLQNEDNLRIMFEDLRNTDDDHFSA